MRPKAAAQLTMGPQLKPGTAIEARCTGEWTVHGIAELEMQLQRLSWPQKGEIAIDASAISALDTSGAWLLHRARRTLEQRGRTVRIEGLRPEFSSLLQSIAAHEVASQAPAPARPGLLARIGQQAWAGVLGTADFLSFIGESTVVLLRSLAQPHRIRWRPILHNLQSAGFDALPITGLLSFLMGIVIA